jgi:glycosidase
MKHGKSVRRGRQSQFNVNGLALTLAWLAYLVVAVPAAQADSFRQRLPEDEIIYFLLPDRFENGDPRNDRGGLTGDRLQTGFDPTQKAFYHGGDLKGLIDRLDYIQSLGATAIWLAPIFKNKPVQGAPGQETAGYHGYWVTDFTQIDPHFGTNADFKAFVAAAHGRGMKVYMDIITNHTADIISYRECPNGGCPYRNRADFPYQRRAKDAAAINTGFEGDGVQTLSNFAKLTDTSYAYTVVVPPAEAQSKVPAWLNDPIFYHNRGDTTYWNESATMGDFSGLDDLMTENPRVIQGMIDIYGKWIDDFGIDGFRVDTARHVNPEFWQAFVPAMLARAKAKGIENFHIFAEIGSVELEPGKLALHTRVDGFPATIDFAFRRAVLDAVSGSAGTNKLWELFFQDPLYPNGEATARQQPTFISSHDHGRLGFYIRTALPHVSDTELLARVKLAHALMMTLRGVPTLYAGDEQGFVGDGWDKDAREPLFASQVAAYNDNRLLGTEATNAVANFNQTHPLYRFIAELSALRRTHPALRRGTQKVRNYADAPGLFAISRHDPDSGEEVLLVFNTALTPLNTHVELDTKAKSLTALYGQCPTGPRAPGSVAVSLPPLGFSACQVK